MAELVGLHARVSADSTGFRAGLESARRDLQAFGAATQQESRRAIDSFDLIGAAWQFTAQLFVADRFTQAIGVMIDDARRFERAMGTVKAITQGSAAELARAERTIRETGLAFGIGANNAAEAAEELLKAGVELEQLSEGALEAAVIMAQATGGTYAEGAEIAAKATQVFRLEAEDMNEVVQGAAGVINATAFQLQDYNLALQQGGAAARDAGLSLQDFNALLALTARALGSSGSDTGTASRTFLSRLVPQSEEARRAMERLNLTFYDTNGAFVGLEETAARLRRAFSGLSDEQRNYNLVTIFGVDAQRQAIALMNEGADGVRRYRDEIIPAADAAAMAEARTDGFAGATMRLRAAFEELGIAIGQSGIMDLLTALTNWAAGGVSNFTTGFNSIIRNGPLAILGYDQSYSELASMGRDRTGRRFTSNQDAVQDALRSHTLDELITWLESERRNIAPWERNRRYRDTYMGEQMYRLFTQERDRRAAAARPPQPPAPPAPAPNTQARPPGDTGAPAAPRRRVVPQLAPIEPLQIEEIPPLDIPDLPPLEPLVLIEPVIFTRETEIYESALRAAEDVEATIKEAFISGEWDWDNISNSLQRAWRSVLWDVFIGDGMEEYMRGLAMQVKGMMSWLLGDEGTDPTSMTSGNGILGWIGRLFGIGGGGQAGAGQSGGAPAGASSIVEGEWDWMRKVTGGFGDWWRILSGGFGGFFEDGGYLPAGQWGIAGERGPEPIYGGRTGLTVLPTDNGASAGATVINFNLPPGSDAHSFMASRAQIEAMLLRAVSRGGRTS